MLDESSLIQNQKAKQTKFILKLKPAHVILLSGTPVGGKYENLWTQVHLLGWNISEQLYNRQYVNWTTIDSGGFQHKIVDKEDPYKNIDRLKSKMREHGAIFKKTEECYELPEQVFTYIRLKAPKEYWKFQKDCIVTIEGQELVGDVKYYFRYMDDIVILARTKEELHQLLKEINEYFHNNMKLEIKKNYQVFPTYVRGIDYLGYRVFVSYVLLRKQTCKDMKKKMVKIRKKVESGNMMNYSEWCSINSYKGWTDYGNCFRLTQKYVEPLIPYATKYYELNVKKGGKVA